MTIVHLSEANGGCSSFMALAGLDQAAMDALPQAVYLCAADGTVVRFNQRAAELWGRAPKAGDSTERFCGSHRLYRTDGSRLPHDQCPMATALRTGESFSNLEVVVEQPCGDRHTVLVNIAALRDQDGLVSGAVNCFQDISDRKQAEERQRLLVAELNHRVKNTLATVHSLAASTARDAHSIGDFTARFEARLFALSQAHTLLFEKDWNGAGLHELLARQLEPFAGGKRPRVRFDGPTVELEPRTALALSMVFHELMTNAAKYGALTVAGGRIAVEWDLPEGADDSRTLTFRWIESGGPPVTAPERKGFGTRLIEQTIRSAGGQAELLFAPPGVELRAAIPLRD